MSRFEISMFLVFDQIDKKLVLPSDVNRKLKDDINEKYFVNILS